MSSNFKNLIIAENGPKPEIVWADSTTNKIKIIRNEKCCLVYDRALTEKGLVWKELIDLWRDRENLSDQTRSEQSQSLSSRLPASIEDNEAEKILFQTYYKSSFKGLGDQLPALIPQICLPYNPYT